MGWQKMFDLLSIYPKKAFTPVFLYHAAFSDVPESLGDAVHNVTPENLYRQVSWLKKYYDVVFVDDLFDSKDNTGKCAITFDDAYLSVFEGAMPVLESLNAPATVFVNGTTLDGQIFWRDKIRLILSRGLEGEFVIWAKDFCSDKNITVENFYKSTKKPHVNSYEIAGLIDQFLLNYPDILLQARNYCAGKPSDLRRSALLRYGNHSFSHFVLSSLSKEQQRTEILKNQDMLSTMLGPEYLSRVFSIPFGAENTVNEHTFDILKETGYKGALLSRFRLNRNTLSSPRLMNGLPVLERIMPDNDWTGFQRGMLKSALKSLT
jgi:peptidoglycan/xylan/chitin deacetylase (PgdA/CDA1 family)